MNDITILVRRLESGCLHAAFEGRYLCPEAREIASALSGLNAELVSARAEVRVLRDAVTTHHLPSAEALISAKAETPWAFLPEDRRLVAEDLAHRGYVAASARVAEVSERLKYRSLESALNDE